jgi:hypothetical protein
LKETAKRLFRENNFEESLKLFELILDVDPSNKESLFYKKKILLKLKPPAGENGQSERPASAANDGSGTGQTAGKASEANGQPKKASGPDLGGRKPNPNCLSCKGSGSCVWCQGSGKCSTCNGTGLSFGATCTTCKGSGACSVCKGTGICSWCIS